MRVRKMGGTEQMIGANIPEKWTVSPIEYENANAVPKTKSAAGDAQ
jgi:hypothetical protein